MTTHTSIDDDTIEALDAATRGSVLRPHDEAYDAARTVWNDRYDREPALILQASGTADVIEGVTAANESEMPIAVKGGGHDYGGHAVADDAFMIDLSAMDGVRVDPSSRTVRAGPGATWADVDHETQQFGLATTGATVSTVGVAGYTLGGGTGHLARRFGMAVDNLVAADVVTAEGELVRASPDENSDLFWALRGGSGNFGIVTSFEFQLHELGPEILAGQIVHPFEEAEAVIRHYRDFMASAPEAVNCYAFIIPIPPVPAFPEERHGDTAVDLVVSYAGDVDAGESALAPLRDFGDLILDSVRPQRYTTFQQAFDDGVPSGQRWYSRARYLEELPDDAIATLVDQTDPLRGPLTMVYLEPMGGVIDDVDPTATAFPHRDAAYSVHALTGWTDPDHDEAMQAWTRDLYEAMAPWAAGGVYVNLLSRDEPHRVPDAYGQNYERLRAVKAQWDPENRFRGNNNIAPAE